MSKIYVKTTLNFTSREELQKYKKFAKDRGQTFSGLIKQLLDNAIRNEIMNDNDYFSELKLENELLRKEINLMHDEINKKIDYVLETLLYRLTKQKTGKLEDLEDKIIEFLNVFDENGKYKKYSLSEIANYLNTTEEITIQAIDSMIKAKKIRIDFNTTKYVKIK